MDEIDKANETADLLLEVAKKLRKPQLLAVGSCWNCDGAVQTGRLFCDAGCKEDYELSEAARLRNHGRI